MDRMVYIPRSSRGKEVSPYHAGFGRALSLARASRTHLFILDPGEEKKSLPWIPGAPGALAVKVMEGGQDAVGWARRRADRKLLRTHPGPVWLLPEGPPVGRHVVLAAVKLPESQVCSTDRLILRAALAHARWEGARVHLIHAWDLIGTSILASRTRGIGPSRTQELLREMEMTRRGRLNALLEAEGLDPQHPSTLERGDLLHVVRRAADATGARTLVAGHRGRMGAWDRIGGNVLEQFLGNPELALFAVRPAGGPRNAGTEPLRRPA